MGTIILTSKSLDIFLPVWGFYINENQTTCFLFCLAFCPHSISTLWQSATLLCVAVAVNSQTDNTKCQRGCGTTRKSLHMVLVGVEDGTDTLENGVTISTKAEQSPASWPTPQYIHNRNARTPASETMFIRMIDTSALFVIAQNSKTWNYSNAQ